MNETATVWKRPEIVWAGYGAPERKPDLHQRTVCGGVLLMRILLTTPLAMCFPCTSRLKASRKFWVEVSFVEKGRSSCWNVAQGEASSASAQVSKQVSTWLGRFFQNFTRSFGAIVEKKEPKGEFSPPFPGYAFQHGWLCTWHGNGAVSDRRALSCWMPLSKALLGSSVAQRFGFLPRYQHVCSANVGFARAPGGSLKTALCDGASAKG